MLVDAAKHGDVEIPVFCYEPKLGEPVGACRMCLVEIEGIPKLQTACSTPVRDGMVVYTRTDRVQGGPERGRRVPARQPPARLPGLRQGRRVPAPGHRDGLGPGRSRVIDPKRHFQKPIPLSPLVKIDRERCILCYRCVRFSQEVAEDEQLQLLERGARTFVGTFDDRPYIAPFHGNIIELCPVGALTSEAYRFRARPWDIEDAGSVCTLCPSQCNVELHGPRRARSSGCWPATTPRSTTAGCATRGASATRWSSPRERITEPMVRAGGELRPASWDEAIDAAAEGLRQAGERTAAIVGGADLERGGLPGPADRPRGARLAARRLPARRRRSTARPLRSRSRGPSWRRAIADIDARRRDPRDRRRPAARDADPRPADPQGGAPQRRPARGRLRAPDARSTAAPRRPPATRPARPRLPRRARGASSGAEGRRASGSRRRWAPTPSAIAGDRLGPRHRPRRSCGRERADGAARPGRWPRPRKPTAPGCSRSPTAPTPAACARSGCLPDAGPGPRRARRRHGRRGDPRGARDGELEARSSVDVDPVRDFPTRPAGARRSARPTSSSPSRCSRTSRPSTPTSSSPPSPTPRRRAPSPIPTAACSACAPSVPHPGDVRPGWQVLVELSAALGHETASTRRPRCSRRSPTRSRSTRHHPRGDRRPRRPLAGPRSGSASPAGWRRGCGRARSHAPNCRQSPPDPPAT